MPGQLQEEVQLLEKRMAKLERLIQHLYEKLDVAAPEGSAPDGGWWGGGDAGDDPGSQEPSEEVMQLLRDGKKIQAIKLHRERTGLGLAESQAAIERYET